jgi:hypothetical protein
MRSAAWIRSQRDRPIAESERRTAMAAVLVLLTAATLLLALTSAGTPPRRTKPAAHDLTPAATPHTPTRPATLAPLTPHLARAATVFLEGYLSYLYGHTPAGQIHGATPALLRSLQRHPPRVSPGIQGRYALVLSLRSAPAAPGLLGVRALVSDSAPVRYPVGLLLTRRSGRLLVSGLGGA